MVRSNRTIANLASAIDSGTTNEFLGLGDSGVLFEPVAYADISNKPTILDSAATIALFDSAYVAARQLGGGLDSAGVTGIIDSAYVQARTAEGGLDSAKMTNLIDSAYITTRVTSGLDSASVTGLVDSSYVTDRFAANSGFDWYLYTATAGQTVFDSIDDNGETLSYTEDGILVFYNGILMLKTYDYTATDGTSVTLNTAADSGANVAVVKYGISSSSYVSPYSAISWGGDRAITTGGNSTVSDIDYWSITTQANAQDFGDLSQARIQAAGTSSTTRGLTFGGQNTPAGGRQNTIDYITISTTGNATDFGDLTQSVRHSGAASNGTRGIRAGGDLSSDETNVMDYVTIATTGNAQDFGDLSSNNQQSRGAADATYATFAGGYDGSLSPENRTLNVIDYVTISTTGNASDFGDLTIARMRSGSLSDEIRGVFGGGYSTSPAGRLNTIDYITIATPGNATDFGDLIEEKDYVTGHSDGTYGNFAGGNGGEQDRIQYITIQTTGNSTDWANLTTNRYYHAGFAGDAS